MPMRQRDPARRRSSSNPASVSPSTESIETMSATSGSARSPPMPSTCVRTPLRRSAARNTGCVRRARISRAADGAVPGGSGSSIVPTRAANQSATASASCSRSSGNSTSTSCWVAVSGGHEPLDRDVRGQAERRDDRVRGIQDARAVAPARRQGEREPGRAELLGELLEVRAPTHRAIHRSTDSGRRPPSRACRRTARTAAASARPRCPGTRRAARPCTGRGTPCRRAPACRRSAAPAPPGRSTRRGCARTSPARIRRRGRAARRAAPTVRGDAGLRRELRLAAQGKVDGLREARRVGADLARRSARFSAIDAAELEHGARPPDRGSCRGRAARDVRNA